MSNWIRGYRIKKYELPLTNDMLECMHAARKMICKKKKAQAKAKEQIKKIKHCRAMIATILSQWDDPKV